MSDFFERAVNFYHMRFIPTVKRMCDRRRIPYTLLTVAVLLLSAAVLSVFICHTSAALAAQTKLETDFQAYLESGGAAARSPIPEMRQILALSRAERIATAILGGMLWLILSIVAIGRVMSSVIESESYVYGLYMIYGAGKRQLTRQLTVEFLLAALLALAGGLPLGYGIYRLLGGTAHFPFDLIWLLALGFLLLIWLTAAVLSGRVLRRPCMRMLNAADTSEFTVSPRTSHLGGLVGRRGAIASALLALWRMRRHYVSLALIISIMASLTCGILSVMPQDIGTREAPYVLHFAEGLTAEGMDSGYVRPLESSPAVTGLSYGITTTAEQLGTHVRLSEAQNPSASGVFLGKQYATESIRIACGDGDSTDELGGQVTIPEEYAHLSLSQLTDLGYQMEAVPAGGAVYVYPEGQGAPLSLKVGDVVKLYLPDASAAPAERVENDERFISVRIVDVVSVGSILVKGKNEEVCPRITEDYLYLSPTDYEKFDGQSHAQAFTAEEAFLPDLFAEAAGSCILSVPHGYFDGQVIPSVVTVISPRDAIKEPFTDFTGEDVLPSEDYFINHTYKGTGVYFGSEKEYMADPFAASELEDHAKSELSEYVGIFRVPTVRREYVVEQVIYTEGRSAPYLILPHGEEVNYATLQNDTCAFRLTGVSTDCPRLTVVETESYLLETDRAFGADLMGRTAYIGTALFPDFVRGMADEGIPLQFPEPTYAHSKVVIRNGFSFGEKHFLMAEPYPFKEFLQSDVYPRYVTGAGSFIPTGDTAADSRVSGREGDFFALLSESSIGRLKGESLPVAGLYARNDFLISPIDEADPRTSLSVGHTVLLTQGTPEDSPIRAGDTVSIAIREDTSALLSDPELLHMDSEQLLSYLLGRISYRYVELIVDEVRHGEHDTLLVSEEDLSAVLGQAGIYTELRISLAPHVEMADYLSFHAALQRLVKSAGGTATLTFDSTFITDTTITDTPNLLLRGIGYVAMGMIPLLLLVSELLFFGKREEEYAILRAIGRTHRERRRLYLSETALFTGLAGLMAALACPVGYFALLLISDLLGLPPAFEGLSPRIYILLILTVLLSSFASGLLAYRRLSRTAPDSGQEADGRQPIKAKGDSHYEGSGM